MKTFLKRVLLVILTLAVLGMTVILAAILLQPSTWNERTEDVGRFLFERAASSDVNLALSLPKEQEAQDVIALCMGTNVVAFLEQEAAQCEAPLMFVPVASTLEK